MNLVRRISLSLFSTLIFSALLFSQPLLAKEAPVIVINIKGEIDGGQAALVKRAVADAEAGGSSGILMEIDTFGGQVDAAVKIRDIISRTPVKTIAYIKNRAWSAGALIAIANEHIAIAPGGSIGAAEPIPTTEKTIAAVKAEFAATAHQRGRNVKIAEAMVDKTMGFPGYANPGQILALADFQAVAVGYADLTAADRKAVLAHYGLDKHQLLEYELGTQEKLAGWLSDPALKSLLLSLMFLAIFTEIKTAGMGVAGAVGLLAALLFFGSQWLTGVAGWFEIVLFIIGILLILIELYMPGFGFWGIGGIVCITSSLFLTLGGDIPALSLLSGSLAAAIILFLLLLRFLPSSKLWLKLVLTEGSSPAPASKNENSDYRRYLNKEGVTQSMLRPAGIVLIDGKPLNAVSEGRYIEPGTDVKVVNIEGNSIVVQEIYK